MDEFFNKISFPYSTVRKGQDEFIRKVYETISQKKNLMVSAPTGLGKTISALAPAIYKAKKEGKTVICLTSRQTQANQIIKTVRDISKKSGERINYMAFIGKRNMCAHRDRELYPAQDFNDFCKKVKETGKCSHYKNFKNSDNEVDVQAVIEESSNKFLDVEGFVELAGSCKFCPYEVAGLKAFKSDLVICDYNYLFSVGIKENFLGKIGRTIEECIVVVDEAHNLPDRIRNSYSYTLSTEILKNAFNELKDHVKSGEYDDYIIKVRQALEEILFNNLNGEKNTFLIEKEQFLGIILSKFPNMKIEDIVEKMYIAAALIKEDKIISYVERVANFVERWAELDKESYIRVMEKQQKEGKTIVSLKIKCIDSSDIASEVLNNSYSSILMSGTLSPIEMYKDILGVANCSVMELESPFLKENQLTLVENDVTTKYSSRGIDMYKRISKHVEEVLNSDPSKNAIVFFPAYDLLDKVVSGINVLSLNRKILKEQRYMTKEAKEKYVELFKSNSGFENKGKVLFAVTSGSFAEGLDLPSTSLEMVVVVGLPLAVPDVFTQAVIRHFDKKFRKGQMYGYIFPAMNKIIQAAGRCIRSEEDVGVVVLMDARFIWPLYAQCFPKHWKMKVVQDNKLEIQNFFNER